MFRFVIAAWNRQSHEAASAASRMLECFDGTWARGFSAYGLCVLHNGERSASSTCLVLPGHCGVILGKLFRNGAANTAWTAPFDVRETERIVASAGEALIQCYWGRYLAVLHDPVVGCSRLVRDPTGALPCFTTEVAGVRLIFSDIQDVRHLPGASWQIDWRYIGARVAGGMLARATERTGLIGVSRVPPGECIDLPWFSRRRLWNAMAIAATDPIENESAATAAIRNAVRQVVWAWGSCYPRALHLLSGGFDSSVVLSCLASAPSRPEVTCVNYYSAAAASDEREHARTAARHFGFELQEIEKVASSVQLARIMHVRRSPVPWSYTYYVEHSAQQGALARERGADGIFSGVGGDQIFVQSALPLAASDLLRRHGIGRSLHYCLNVARVHGDSLWSVLLQALQGLRGWHPANEAGHGRKLASADLIQSVREDRPSVRHFAPADPRTGAGKQRHMHSMDLGHEFYDPLGGDDYPERTRPLVSQPLIETCLRIPVYVLAANGVDRCSARRAFSEALPTAIVHRQTKGTIDSHILGVFRANIPFVREVMLDGMLVRDRLLDRTRVEETFSLSGKDFGRQAIEIVGIHLSIEAWARGWTR